MNRFQYPLPPPVTLLVTLLFTLLPMQGAVAAEAGVQGPGGHRRALLIGINQYRSETVPALRGCVNDVLLLRHILESRYGFDRITTLLDAEATRDKILSALQRIVAETEPDDFLFVHFSGHGSQQADLNGDEEDGLDETLVAHDSRSAEVPDIVDDEIDVILASLRTSNAVISFDACHSGTGTRAMTELRSRDIDPDPRSHLYESISNKLVASRSSRNTRYLAISSALAREKALDGPVDGVPHGLFTRALTKVLASQPLPGEGAPALASAAECERLVLAAYRDIVEALGCSHRASTPTFELVNFAPDPAGARRRLMDPLLPAPRAGRGARRPFVTVRAGQEGQIHLPADPWLGAMPGSYWAIHGPKDSALLPGKALAHGRVSHRSGQTAILELTGGEPGDRSLEGFRAVQAAFPEPPAQTHLRIELTAEEQQRARALLQRSHPGERIVLRTRPDETANFVLRRGHDAESIEVLSGDEATLVRQGVSLDEAVQVVARTLTAGRLLNLDNPTSAMRLRVSTDFVGGLVEDRQIGLKRARRPSQGGSRSGHRVYREGDPVDRTNCLQLHLEVDQDCYLSIVNVDGSGKVGLLFPNALSEEYEFLPDGFVRGGQTFSIPDRVSEDCQAGFLWPLLTVGRETVRVFATADLGTAERIRSVVRAVTDLQRDHPDDTLAVENMLRELRSELLEASLTGREIGVMGVGEVPNRPRRRVSEEPGPKPAQAPPAGDWTAASVSFPVQNAGQR